MRFLIAKDFQKLCLISNKFGLQALIIGKLWWICKSYSPYFNIMICFKAELVMHSERVTRHTKGIIQALAELRQGFNKMTQEHNKLASKFREDIEALEVVFVNATKSSK